MAVSTRRRFLALLILAMGALQAWDAGLALTAAQAVSPAPGPDLGLLGPLAFIAVLAGEGSRRRPADGAEAGCWERAR